MAKESFIQPRFVGARFDEHTLPLSAAKDLAAYEELVLELAKHLYLEKHGHRQRVPKGFADGFHLHLERVDGGSAKPLLALVAAGSLVCTLPVEFTEARDLINQVIATDAGGRPPATFPKEYYSYFNRIGRSLEKDEQIEWTPGQGNATVLTPGKRKSLVLAAGQTYEAEVDVVGRVFDLNTEKNEGQLRTGDNEKIVFDFDPPFLSELKQALGDRVTYIHLEGIGVFDVNDRLKSIKEVSRLDVVRHYELTTKIDSLVSLVDGWLEGHGAAPAVEHLLWLANEIATSFPDNLEYPSIAPTEEGNVVFEWIRPDTRIELEVNFGEEHLELYATKSGEFIEEVYDQGQWEDAFARVSEFLMS